MGRQRGGDGQALRPQVAPDDNAQLLPIADGVRAGNRAAVGEGWAFSKAGGNACNADFSITRREFHKTFLLWRAWLFSDTQLGAEASCGIYSITTTAKGNGLSPFRYLEWLLEVMPNTPNVDDPDVLEGLMPWSPRVPDACRLTPAEAAKDDPMAKPYIDVDPHALDLDEQ